MQSDWLRRNNMYNMHNSKVLRKVILVSQFIIISYEVVFEIQGWTRLELLLLRFKPHRVSLTPKKSCTLNIYVTYMQAFAILQLLMEILISEKE